ncbi:MAG: hypothetical protein RI575_09580 [Balneolaceae bacterium]|nr:hypothetical protein [Balneolaceae bacterium]MDR9408329.1 hypothetical protein [Balneolaceae bacterium]
MKLFKPHLLFSILLVGLIPLESSAQEVVYDPPSKRGTFSYDVNFLEEYTGVVVLGAIDSNGKILVTPTMQGRVMTSSVSGDTGKSLGWVNHELIESGEILEQFTPYGGEDRFWIAPEGGQYSVFITPGEDMVFENWYVPPGMNTEPWNLVSQSGSHVSVEKDLLLTNYSNVRYEMHANRTINLLNGPEVESLMGIEVMENIQQVAYETENTIRNTGKQAWTKETGAPAIWILSMFTPAPGITVVVPFKEGAEDELGPIATTDIFGEITEERLKIDDGVIYFKVDGEKRRKFGVGPKRAHPVAGSYDETNNILTIIQYTFPENNLDFVNQQWEIQDEPYNGEVVFAYNDGPLEDGSQLGPFYELESSSPAAFLAPGEELTHHHRVFHFSGEGEALNRISEQVLGVSLQEIVEAF